MSRSPISFARRVSRGNFFSAAYLHGWGLLLILLVLPFASYRALGTYTVWFILPLLLAGYGMIRLAEKSPMGARSRLDELPTSRKSAWAVILFSILSIIGSRLVLSEQPAMINDLADGTLQDKYIALTQMSLLGESGSSYRSLFGNILRAFFFVALTSLVSFTRVRQPFFAWVSLTGLVGFALYSNFLTSVSRTYIIFCVVVLVFAARSVEHPLLRRKGLLLALAFVGLAFLAATNADRYRAKFADTAEAAQYIPNFFVADLQPLGEFVSEEYGAPVLAIGLYLSHSLPEFVTLVESTESQYRLGTHSFYLVAAPLARMVGITIGTDMSYVARQGMWWGVLGDLYLDFGYAFPLAYLILVYVMVRLALGVGKDTVFGLSFWCMTIGMMFCLPYFGVFNTYSVSYFGVLAMAWLTRRRRYQPSHAVRKLVNQNEHA